MRLGKRERAALRVKAALRIECKRRANMTRPGHVRSAWDNLHPRGKPCHRWGFQKGGIRPVGAQI